MVKGYRRRYKARLRKIKACCHRIERCRQGLRDLMRHYICDDGMWRRLMPAKPVLPEESAQKLVSVTKA